MVQKHCSYRQIVGNLWFDFFYQKYEEHQTISSKKVKYHPQKPLILLRQISSPPKLQSRNPRLKQDSFCLRIMRREDDFDQIIGWIYQARQVRCCCRWTKIIKNKTNWLLSSYWLLDPRSIGIWRYNLWKLSLRIRQRTRSQTPGKNNKRLQMRVYSRVWKLSRNRDWREMSQIILMTKTKIGNS